MRKNNSSKFIKYTNIGIQMLVVILLGVWGGQKLDVILENENPVFTIILSLLSVFAAIYLAIKDLLKMNK